MFSVPLKTEEDPSRDWLRMIGNPQATFTMVRLTQYHVPEAETFNLLGEGGDETREAEKAKKREGGRRSQSPVTHLRARMTVSMMTDDVKLPTAEVPPELYHLVRRSPKSGRYLPIVYVDELNLRLKDLVVVNATDQKGSIDLM